MPGMKFTTLFRNEAGRLAFVRTPRYDTEEGATAACREFLADHRDLASFTLWIGLRKITEGRRRARRRA